MTRFFILFVIILVTLFAAELTQPVQSTVVLPWTEVLARISAGLITPFDSHVVAFGKILQNTTNGFYERREPGKPTLASIREALTGGLPARLIGDGVLEEDEADLLMAEIEELIERSGTDALAEEFLRYE